MKNLTLLILIIFSQLIFGQNGQYKYLIDEYQFSPQRNPYTLDFNDKDILKSTISIKIPNFDKDSLRFNWDSYNIYLDVVFTGLFTEIDDPTKKISGYDPRLHIIYIIGKEMENSTVKLSIETLFNDGILCSRCLNDKIEYDRTKIRKLLEENLNNSTRFNLAIANYLYSSENKFGPTSLGGTEKFTDKYDYSNRYMVTKNKYDTSYLLILWPPNKLLLPTKVTDRQRDSTSEELKYYQIKSDFKKALEKFERKYDRLKSDSMYSKLDLNKIRKSADDFKDIDKFKQNLNRLSIRSTNNLRGNFIETINVLLKKRRFKKDTEYSIKYEYLMININELHKFIMKENNGLNQMFLDFETEILTCSLNYFQSNEKESTNTESTQNIKCGIGGDFKYTITAVGEPNEVNNLRVLYLYSRPRKNEKPEQYDFLTSPSACQYIIGGIYDFWLFDEKNNKIVSQIAKEVNLSELSEVVKESGKLGKDIRVIK